MTRDIEVDLHTHRSTVWMLSLRGGETIETHLLQGGGVERFCAGVHRDDDIAVEATGHRAVAR